MDIIKRVEANTIGNDYICGDVHGYYEHVEQLLNYVNFDSATDRLFFVGDLVDRGPDSIKCLDMLDLPWVHSVLGNHEQMMLDGVNDPHFESRFFWLQNGGGWAAPLTTDQLSPLVDKVKQLPIVLVVGEESNDRFNIVHAQPEFINNNATILSDATIDATQSSVRNNDERPALWGRNLLHKRYRGVDLSNLSTTYVGHSSLNQHVRIGPIHYIDGGACYVDSMSSARLTFACHTKKIMYNYFPGTKTFTQVMYSNIEDSHANDKW